MRVRTKVRLISFITASVLIILGAGVTGYNLANTYKSTIQYIYQRSLSELSDYFTSIKSTLTKGVYANTAPQQYGLASKLMVEAESAKNALSQLPVSQVDSEAVQKYLTQVSDFASFVIGMLSRNELLSEDNTEAMYKLLEYAESVAPQLEELSAYFIDENKSIGEALTLNGNITETSTNESKTEFDNSFLTISQSFVDYPTLIYDGPFADSVQNKAPKQTTNAQGCTVNQAKKALAEFAGLSPDLLKYKEKRHSALPVYVFEAEGFYGTVTEKGCYVCEMYFTSTVDSTATKSIDYEKALQLANDFFKKNHINSMEENYYALQNNIYLLNFAYKENQTTCYGDLIKVGVSATDGKIVSYNAHNYLMNHYERNLGSLPLTKQEAQKSVSNNLTVVKSKRALIPLANGKEVHCYEFTCTGKNDENVLVYINGNTGLEEQIFILMQNSYGSLVV
ncbi:MAG: germination protein YpeB [Acutalibacteraceae bacterium]|nr:germination protein YpeB [Acutalibacteraceae bacterium]